jgi:aminopeptidase YwaD
VNGNVNGDLVYAGLGKKDELQNMNLSGKIALIKRGDITFAEKILNAVEKGAIGVIIFNNTNGALSGTLGEHNNGYAPAISLSKAEGEVLVSKLNNSEKLAVSLKIEGASAGDRISHNVIAKKKSTNKNKDTNNILIVGAHHDSVSGAPGANDDALGTSMALELARVFKNLPTDTEIRFITFGAEEVGLIGSTHYVQNLNEDELERTIANFNLDIVGSKDAGNLVMTTLDGKPNLVRRCRNCRHSRL